MSKSLKRVTKALHDAGLNITPVELGEHQYHLELLKDEEAGKMKAWILDGHLENFIRVKSQGFEVKAAE